MPEKVDNVKVSLFFIIVRQLSCKKSGLKAC